MIASDFSFYGNQVIIKSEGTISGHAKHIVYTDLFAALLDRYLASLREHQSPLLGIFSADMSPDEQHAAILRTLQGLADRPREAFCERYPDLAPLAADSYLLLQFVENLYNYWRYFERFFVCYSQEGLDVPLHEKPYRTFNDTIENLNHQVRSIYRDICENITYDHPRIYRQMPAGCQVGLIVTKADTRYPDGYPQELRCIPFIRQVLIVPPLIIDPPMNKRSGQFTKVDRLPIADGQFNGKDWLCYPAKVGDLVIFVFFHNTFIGLGTSLSNLFELADEEDLARGPDAIYAYGALAESLADFGPNLTVFYDDTENDMLVAAVPGEDQYGYFGYVKKMMLTLHNIIMIKRGRLPIHGAMVRICLKDGKCANVVIVGDTGAGKSESLEAFRVLGEEKIRSMTIIFDDMGSLEMADDGTIRAYGTETGAFVRLDDLQPGFAFGNLDRSIIMSPQKINARAVLPVTTLTEVLAGHPVDYLLYANNYEQVDGDHPFFEEFHHLEDALNVFREGARMAKGTTTEQGIVHSYFANIFGPLQYREIHEELAQAYFAALFAQGITVAQLRTRLGIPGLETEGPESAARALLDVISQR